MDCEHDFPIIQHEGAFEIGRCRKCGKPPTFDEMTAIRDNGQS